MPPTDASRSTSTFDFLQDLVGHASAALPAMGQWVAPTLDPQELARRIGELRTVQLWLEQNARLLDTTIQALEVQRMTLSTLKTMNVQMDDLREALTARAAAAPGAAAAPAGPVDPMQWWGTLTRQFGELTAGALKEAAQAAAPKASAPGAEAAKPSGTAGDAPDDAGAGRKRAPKSPRNER